MRILRYDDDRIGVMHGEHVVDISELITYRPYRGPQGSMEELISSFDAYRPKIEALITAGVHAPISKVRLRSPLARPSRVLAAFVNYWNDPDRSAGRKPLEFFHKSPHLIGPGGDLQLPDVDAVVEFQPEVELAFVIGRAARHVRERDAMDHVFGFIPYVDLSARGMTRKSQFLPKGQDGFSACGPWITTRDEIGDPHDLTIRSWINGEPKQNFSTSLMVYSIPEQIAWLSRFVELRPGDLVTTGGFHAGLGPINVGDMLEIEITGLGRTHFLTAGDSPHKAAQFKPGGGGGLAMTPV
ncbi:MAG: fumarylacetoacetate hydrolase family protein [Beijerinckiaceae bacterium]|nr:fumarylacetoacetate hydrolase family protein [Beijerinckiaceae bacterium]